MSKLQTIDGAKFGLTPERTKQAKEMFLPMLEKMESLEIEAKQILSLEENEETAKQAKEVRLKLVKVRTGTAKIHKDLKAEALNYGKFIDSWKNLQLSIGSGIETQLKEREQYLERIEEERKRKEVERIQTIYDERCEVLRPFKVNETMIYPPTLGEMDDKEWGMTLSAWKDAHNTHKENERLRIEAENRLREEREQREKEERERVEKERKEREEREKRERAEKQKEIDQLHRARVQVYETKIGPISGVNLGEMSDDEWEGYLNQCIENKRNAEIEAEKRVKAEAERLEREKKEKEEREAQLKAEKMKQMGDMGVIMELKTKIREIGEMGWSGKVESEKALELIKSVEENLRGSFRLLNAFKTNG